jgi:hypothetical protein
MGHLLGDARVSTTDQQSQLQVDALERAGCYRVFTETASGARTDRPILEQVLDQLRPGDTLVVWKLDRLGRSLRHLAVVTREVGDAADGWLAAEGGVGSVMVVPTDPGRQGPMAGGVGVLQPPIGHSSSRVRWHRSALPFVWGRYRRVRWWRTPVEASAVPNSRLR